MDSSLLALLLPLALPDLLHPPVRIELGSSPAGLEVADLDGDGDLDVAVALQEVSAVRWFAGDGTGALGGGALLPLSGRTVAVAAGDLDLDGVQDLVAVHGDGDGHALLGTGGGAFGPPIPADLVGEPSWVLVASLDADGVPDLVVGSSENVLVSRGLGDGTFDVPRVHPMGGLVRRLALSDVDDDGNLDVMVAAELGGTKLLRNQGGLLFQVEQVPGTFAGISDWVAMGDVDEDGDPDVTWIENDGFASDPEVRPNDGNGVFGDPFFTVFIKEERQRIVELAHLRGQGDPEWVCIGGQPFFPTNPPMDTLAVRLSAPGLSGGLAEMSSLPGRLVDLRVADLDGDGRDELIGSDGAGDALVLLPNSGCFGSLGILASAPEVAPALADPAPLAVLQGCGLAMVEGVTVGGVPADFALGSSGELLVELPPAPALGAVSISVSSSLGTAAATVEYVPPPAPLLVLEGGPEIEQSEGLTLRAGAAPGDLMLLALSPHLVPSVFPGLVTFDIGNGGTSLILPAALAIPAPAWLELEATLPPGLVGSTLYFQGAVATPPVPSLPLVKTPVATAIIVP